MSDFYKGQKLKNSPQDDIPYFKIIDIQQTKSGLKSYKVKSMYEETELILHEESLYPYEKE